METQGLILTHPDGVHLKGDYTADDMETTTTWTETWAGNWAAPINGDVCATKRGDIKCVKIVTPIAGPGDGVSNLQITSTVHIPEAFRPTLTDHFETMLVIDNAVEVYGMIQIEVATGRMTVSVGANAAAFAITANAVGFAPTTITYI